MKPPHCTCSTIIAGGRERLCYDDKCIVHRWVKGEREELARERRRITQPALIKLIGQLASSGKYHFGPTGVRDGGHHLDHKSLLEDAKKLLGSIKEPA